MSNSESTDTVYAWIEGFRDMSSNYMPTAAKEVAATCKAELDQAISEQRSVTGKQWAPRKTTRHGKPRSDAKGKNVLLNAASHVMTKAIGTVVMIILEGPDVFHQFGAGHNPRREIIPGTSLGKLGNAIAKGLVDMGATWMTRKGRHDKSFGGRSKPVMGGSS